MTAFSAQAPELEAKMDAILGKLKLVEEGHAEGDAPARVGGRARRADLARQRARAVRREARRAPERPERLSADVDRKLEEQLARRAELDTLKAACDGLAAQMVDAQHKLEAVRTLQTSLVPLVAEVNKLQGRTSAPPRRGWPTPSSAKAR